MDSNKPTIVATVEAASNVLRNLGFLGADAVVPKPSNLSFQVDGWRVYDPKKEYERLKESDQAKRRKYLKYKTLCNRCRVFR